MREKITFSWVGDSYFPLLFILALYLHPVDGLSGLSRVCLHGSWVRGRVVQGQQHQGRASPPERSHFFPLLLQSTREERVKEWAAHSAAGCNCPAPLTSTEFAAGLTFMLWISSLYMKKSHFFPFTLSDMPVCGSSQDSVLRRELEVTYSVIIHGRGPGEQRHHH